MKNSVKSLQIDEYICIPGLHLSVAHSGAGDNWGADYPVHGHEFSEIVIVRQGQGRHLLDDDSYVVQEGDIFVVQPGHRHGYVESSEMWITNILFDPGQCLLSDADLRTLPGYHALFTLEPHFRSDHRLSSCLHSTGHALSRIEALTTELESELELRAPGSRTLALALFRQLVVLLCRAYDGARNDMSRSLMRLASVVSWMEAHCHETVTIGQLCERSYMARSTFHRVFVEIYGSSPLEYLIALRTERAEMLLRETDLTVTEVALQAGFSDGNYLARQFRRRKGCAPGDLRRGRDRQVMRAVNVTGP